MHYYDSDSAILKSRMNRVDIKRINETLNSLPAKYNFSYEASAKNHVAEFLKETLGSLQSTGNSSDICGHVFKRGEPVYHCYTCGIDSTCVLCSKCFNATKHENHKVSVLMSGETGGCCDCGDKEAFKVLINCPFHKGSDTNNENRKVNFKENSEYQDVKLKIYALLSFCVGSLAAWYFEENQSPDDLNSMEKVKSVEQLKAIYPGEKSFALVLWNDEFHSYNEVTDIIKDIFSQSQAFGHLVAEEVDGKGRKVLAINEDLDLLRTYARRLTQIRLSCCIRPARYVFMEEVAYDILLYILNLCSSNELVKQSFLDYLFEYADAGRWQIFDDDLNNKLSSKLDVLKASFRRRSSSFHVNLPTNGDLPEFHQNGLNTVLQMDKVLNIDLLLLFDVKLWKNLRKELNKAYVSLILPDLLYKQAVGIRFYFFYDLLARYFVYSDRESERSVYMFSLQLLTNPSVAVFMQNNYRVFELILTTLKSFYLLGQDRTKELVIDYESNVNNYSPIPLRTDSGTITSCDGKIFQRRKRLYHLYSDLKYIMNSITITGNKAGFDKETLKGIIDFVSIFNGMNPLVKETSSHVEFEDTQWVSAFETSIKVSALIGEVTDLIKSDHELNVVGLELALNKANSCSSRTISFHHPTVWFVGHVVENLKEEAYKILMNMDTSCLMDEVLKVLSLCSEIRAGLWVRNGEVMRNQLLNYKSNRMWNDCYDVEVYLLQALGFTMALKNDVESFWLNLIENYYHVRQILVESKSAIDSVELRKGRIMIEEFLITSICLVANSLNVRADPQFECIMEIISQLATGPCTYSKLQSVLSDRQEKFCEETGLFDDVLNNVAELKFPDVMENGRFEAKSESLENYYFPYFQHVLPSSREKAMDYISKRSLKETFNYVPSLTNFLQNAPEKSKELIDSHVFFKYLLQIMISYQDNNVIMELCFCLIHIIIHYEIINKIFEVSFEEKGEKVTIVLLLIQLQKNDLIDKIAAIDPQRTKSFLSKTQSSMDIDISSDAKSAAADRRKEIMNKFKNQQNQFSENFKDLLDEIEDSDDEDDVMANSAPMNGYRDLHSFDKPVCILCQESLSSGKEYGLLSLFQMTYILQEECFYDKVKERHPQKSSFITTCGHLMHFECLSQYFDANAIRRMRFIHSTDGDLYMCPLCKSVGNTFLPLKENFDYFPMDSNVSCNSFDSWIKSLSSKQDPEGSDLKYLDEHAVFDVELNSMLSDALESYNEDPGHYDHRSSEFNSMFQRNDNNTPHNEDDEDCVISLTKLLFHNICVNEVSYRSLIITPTYSNFLANYYLFNLIMYYVPNVNCKEGFVNHLLENKFILFHDQFELLLVLCCYHSFQAIEFDMKYRKYMACLFLTFEFTKLLVFYEKELDNIEELYNSDVKEEFNIEEENIKHFLSLILPNFNLSSVSISKFFNFLYTKTAVYRNRVDLFFNHVVRFKETHEQETSSFDSVFGCDLSTFFSEKFILNPTLIQYLQKAVEHCKKISDTYTTIFFSMNVISQQTSLYKELPLKCSDLLELQKPCPICKTVPSFPAICLFCGCIVCTESVCCSSRNGINELQSHVIACKKSVGIFLLVKRCFVLMSYKEFEVSVMAPYMDEHGETDVGLRLGTIQKFHEGRYKELEKLWIEHKIPDFVLRRLDASSRGQFANMIL